MEVIEQTTHDRVTQSASFRLEEATIDELHQAIRAGQTSCLAVGRHCLTRVRAFNGVASALVTQDGAPTLESTGTVRAGAPLRFPCDTVKATTILPNLDQYRGPSLEFGRMEATASDPSVQQQFGMIVGIPNARQVNALATLNIRGERSVTCRGEFGKATRIPVHRKARPLLRWRPERWHDKGGLMRGRISRPTIAVVALLAALCLAPRDQAASAPEIDASVSATLEDFFREVWSGRDLANQAVAILVFPTIVKAGFGIGGEYGEGALHIRGRTAGYYNIVSASIGFQFGAQARSVIIMFMTEAALANFQRTDGWKVGIDGSIAIITVGAGGQIDTSSIRSPVIGFIFDQKGLMYNLTLEGSKISRIQR